MNWIVSMLLAFVVCGIVFAVGRAMRSSEEPALRAQSRIVIPAAFVLLVLWVGGHTIGASVKQIPAGHVGVVYEFGAIVDQTASGLQVIPPWRSVKAASTQVQRQRFDGMSSFSRETQDVIMSVTLNYQVDPDAIQRLYREVGPNWNERLIESRVSNFLKEETVKYESVEVAPNREQIRSAVRGKLATELQGFSVRVIDFLIDNIEFRPEFKQAIEQKQIATQDALREQERIKQKQAEAQQGIEAARGEAESVKLRAAGDAEATKIRADAQASANRALAASLTPEVLQFTAIDRLADNIQIALIPSGQGLIIDPSTILRDR
ncbi:MAG: SPFH domain-containing protein [Dehalococcoidia bacterium]